MASITFNTYEFIKSLEKTGLSEKQAEAITSGILRAQDSADVATKGDLRELELRMNAKLDNLEARMTIKLGSMMIVAVSLLSVIIKLF